MSKTLTLKEVILQDVKRHQDAATRAQSAGNKEIAEWHGGCVHGMSEVLSYLYDTNLQDAETPFNY